jgi:hypothetical protein
MGIRSWLERRRREGDAAALRRAEDEAVETGAERDISRGNRAAAAADQRIARRGGRASIDDVDRLSDF